MDLGDHRLTAEALDISVLGLSVRANLHGKRGHFLRISFSLPGCPDTVWTDAVLVREAQSGTSLVWGLLFCGPDASCTRKIELYVRSELRKQAQERLAPTKTPSAPATETRPTCLPQPVTPTELSRDGEVYCRGEESSEVVSTDMDFELGSLYKAAVKRLKTK